MTDPVLQRVLQGLARRAQAAPEGPLRQRLQAAQARWAAQAGTPLPAPRPHALAPGPLGALLADLRAQLPSAPQQGVHGTEQRAAEQPEPRLLQAHRREWAALQLAQRLAEPVPLPAAPGQIGPLHTQAVVPRALRQLHALSPVYLQRLLAQVDTLAQLSALAAPPTTTPRASAQAIRSAPRRAAPQRPPAG